MDYLRTTKPRVVLLFLTSAWAAYALAGGGFGIATAAAAAGLAACIGGAAALNNYLERDRDRLMERTRARPLPAGRIAPRRVLVLGSALIVIGAAVLLGFAGPAPAAWALAGAGYYVVAYTKLLKPRFSHSAVPGGVAGLFPAIVGWSAGAARAAEPAPWLLLAYLLAVVFLWSPPHFWALTLVRREEYRTAAVPVPPNTSGVDVTRLQMLSYTLALLGVSLLPGMTGLMGAAYTLTAAVSGGLFAGLVIMGLGGRGPALDAAVFKLSGPYLAVILAAMVADGSGAARAVGAMMKGVFG